MEALKLLMIYLWATKDYKLTFSNKDSVKSLQTYVDASYKSSAEGNKSVLGLVIMLGGGPIVWKSKRINTVNASTADSEILALAPATRETVKVRLLRNELGFRFNAPTKAFEDNQSVNNIINGNATYDGEPYLSKRMDVLKELTLSRRLKLTQIGTNDQVADGFTKAFGTMEYASK